MCLFNGKGKTYDFKLFKNSGVKFGDLIKVIADKGYLFCKTSIERLRYEYHRNATIAMAQGNRNPLIDFPEWSDKIDLALGFK